MNLSRRDLLATTAAGTLVLGLPTFAAPAAGSSDAALKGTLDALANRLLDDSPQTVTFLGLDKGARAAAKSKLDDASWAYIAGDAGRCADWLKRLDAVPSAGLSPAASIDKDTVAFALTLGRDGGRFDFGDNTLGAAMGESASPYVVSQETGAFVGIPEFLDSQHRIDVKADADAYLARVEAFAVSLDQETERVKRDTGMGVSPPDFLLATALGQMTRFRATPAAQSRLVVSLATRAKAKGIAGDYAGDATKLVAEKVYPALDRQIAVLKDVAAKATHDAGVWKLKDGEAYYAWLLRVGTSTGHSAAEIHQMGLAQNAAIQSRMDGLLKAQGFSQGTVGARMTALSHDKRFIYPDNDQGRAEIIAYLNDRIADMRGRLGQAFDLKLKAPVVVKRVPPDIQDGAGLGYMNPAALDGSRPAIYYINLKTTTNWPRFTLPTLTYHETIPGHAWQLGYMTETGKLPLIRTILSGFNAYVEGWALYAEQLADELGLYAADPFGQLGYLQAQQFRACRLVADTGLHAMRWSREQAISWLVDATGRVESAMRSEVDRYCGTPGQACGYKVGHSEILRLRAKAQNSLGAKFDLKTFDDTVVETGPVPLTVLALVIGDYIAHVKAM